MLVLWIWQAGDVLAPQADLDPIELEDVAMNNCQGMGVVPRPSSGNCAH